MAVSEPVSDDELRQFPEHISNHFDRVRDLLAKETGDPDA